MFYSEKSLHMLMDVIAEQELEMMLRISLEEQRVEEAVIIGIAL